MQKNLRFGLSSACIEKIQEYNLRESEVIVGIELYDVKKRKICSQEKKCTIKLCK